MGNSPGSPQWTKAKLWAFSEQIFERNQSDDDVEVRLGLSPHTETRQFDENTGISTNESLPVLSPRVFVCSNPINTRAPKVLTSHPSSLGVPEMVSGIGGRKKKGVETRRGGVSPSRIHLPSLGKTFSFSIRSMGEYRIYTNDVPDPKLLSLFWG